VIKTSLNKLIIGSSLLAITTTIANAHPHVFVEANMDVVLNEKGEFTELRQVWRFDEIFSATVIIDYDENADGKLDEKELEEVATTVKGSIAEYDFYTALRSGENVIEFFEPKTMSAYFEDSQMIMFFSINPSKPFNMKDQPLRISASDTSYYVAFDFAEKNISLTGSEHDCTKKVVNPDFDKLYADNSETLSESFFNDTNQTNDLGDEFYSWATISCK